MTLNHGRHIGYQVNNPNTQYLIRTNKKAHLPEADELYGWAHKDLNLGPPDYESDALTN